MSRRESTVTAESLESYKDLVKVATDDLEAHLQSIDDKLEDAFGVTARETLENAAELQRIKEIGLARRSVSKPAHSCLSISTRSSSLPKTALSQKQQRPVWTC